MPILVTWWEPGRLGIRLGEERVEVPVPGSHGGQRLPGVSTRVDVTAWDFFPSQPTTVKTYRSIGAHAATIDSCRAFGGDLGAAAAIQRECADGVAPAMRDRTGFLQLTGSGQDARPKIFFFTRAWGWSEPEGMVRLLEVMASLLGVDLEPLRVVRATSRAHGVPLQLGLVAVAGPLDAPTVTWYFWPT